MEKFDSIICISQTPWQGDFQKAIVQLTTELSVRHRMIYVDYQYTVKDFVNGLRGRQPAPVRELVRLKDPLTKRTFDNGGEAWVWVPPLMLPINWMDQEAHDRLIHWNVGRLVKGLRRVMKKLDMKRPLVINAFNPVWGVPMLGQLNECATIYYCFDEITTAGNWMSRHGHRYEQEYLRRVHAVVTTSETLRQAKSVLQPNAFCVKNGANFDLFHTARKLARENPPTTPVVGYLGTADNRVNVDLVEYCARTMPDVTFRFIGEVKEPRLAALSKYPNVEFIPPHQPADLPPLLAKLSAAMIPFACNEHTYTIYPLKINEYLAAGLPVVSTPFSILDDFNGVIELAGTPEEFAQALRRGLSDNTPFRIRKRVEMAQGNTWAKRAEEFEAVLRRIPAAWSAGPPEPEPHRNALVHKTSGSK
ncbi:glycosyltransferase [Larkinella soli]|uniref:glycosyltransferase n=1 Tax=Larkinella soli TaxID=1770527 RepID=UPI000FFC7F2D|nr:glycosyltransferase [Larkinella soli]